MVKLCIMCTKLDIYLSELFYHLQISWRSDYFEETTVTFGRLYTGSDMTLIMGHQQKKKLRSNTYRDIVFQLPSEL
jgi:hypothetical protein